jgi:hypothetical protein
VRLIVNVIALVILRGSSFDCAQDDITALRMTWLKMGSGDAPGDQRAEESYFAP